MSHLDTAYRLGAAAAQEKFAELEKQGFTLIELMLTTALLGTGAALTLPPALRLTIKKRLEDPNVPEEEKARLTKLVNRGAEDTPYAATAGGALLGGLTGAGIGGAVGKGRMALPGLLAGAIAGGYGANKAHDIGRIPNAPQPLIPPPGDTGPQQVKGASTFIEKALLASVLGIGGAAGAGQGVAQLKRQLTDHGRGPLYTPGEEDPDKKRDNPVYNALRDSGNHPGNAALGGLAGGVGGTLAGIMGGGHLARGRSGLINLAPILGGVLGAYGGGRLGGHLAGPSDTALQTALQDIPYAPK